MRSWCASLAIIMGVPASVSGCLGVTGPVPATPRPAVQVGAVPTLALARRRVLLHVTNAQDRAARIYVIRAGRSPALLGVVPRLSRATFDVSGIAPVGSRVRFAAHVLGDTRQVLTPPVEILRAGMVLIEIEPVREVLRTALVSGRSAGSG